MTRSVSNSLALRSVATSAAEYIHRRRATMTQQEIYDQISKIEWVLEHDTDLSQNRVMALGGEWAGLKKRYIRIAAIYDEGMWAMLHRLRGI